MRALVRRSAATSGISMNLQNIVRKSLLYAATGTSTLTSVDVREIRFEPGQQTGRHLHPCHVFGYIVEGRRGFKSKANLRSSCRLDRPFMSRRELSSQNSAMPPHLNP
jgi:hypothetical protein